MKCLRGLKSAPRRFDFSAGLVEGGALIEHKVQIKCVWGFVFQSTRRTGTCHEFERQVSGSRRGVRALPPSRGELGPSSERLALRRRSGDFCGSRGSCCGRPVRAQTQDVRC